MAVVVSLLRGINVGGHKLIKMETLRALYESLGFRDVRTYVQSGNVVFRTQKRDLVALAKSIEEAIERTVGFRPSVVLRTTADLRDVTARNPFTSRDGIEPGKLLVSFLARDPGSEVREKVLKIKADPEELRMDGRELYIYFPNGMGRPKLSLPALEKTLGVPATGRNWNTVRKLLEMAEQLEE